MGLTPIDRVLAKYRNDRGEITFERLAKAHPIKRAACLARLASLDRLGVVAGGAWRLDDGWGADLVRMEKDTEIAQRLRTAQPASLGRCVACNRASPSRGSRAPCVLSASTTS